MEMVRVKDSTKRRKRPTILTVQTFEQVVAGLPEPFRTMAVVAQCLGLRVSEILGLQWSDFDLDRRVLLVQRCVVHGRVVDLNTQYSHDYVPLHQSLLNVLLDWKEKCPPTDRGWFFASPLTGEPYYSTEIQERYLRPAGVRLGLGPIGWHTFRHTYRSWLDDRGADESHGSRVNPNDDERVWAGDAGVEEGSQWEGCHDGAQANESERLKCQFSYWE